MRRVWIFALLGSLQAAPTRAQVVAVLSSGSPYYRQAFEGFQSEFKSTVPVVVLNGAMVELPARTRVVVAIGAKATLEPYPKGVKVVYCLALGVDIQRPGAVKVHTYPSPENLLQRLTELYPALSRLSALWVSENLDPYMRRLRAAARKREINFLVRRLSGAEQLPDALRGVRGRTDALWIPPDPLLLDPVSFDILRDFAEGNDTPLFVSAPGLAEKGAAASLTASFDEVGALCARAARELISGKIPEPEVYPSRARLTLNPAIAAAAGLDFPREAVRQADKVVP